MTATSTSHLSAREYFERQNTPFQRLAHYITQNGFAQYIESLKGSPVLLISGNYRNEPLTSEEGLSFNLLNVDKLEMKSAHAHSNAPYDGHLWGASRNLANSIANIVDIVPMSEIDRLRQQSSGDLSVYTFTAGSASVSEKLTVVDFSAVLAYMTARPTVRAHTDHSLSSIKPFKPGFVIHEREWHQD